MMDEKQEQAVWARVRGEEPPCGKKAEPILDPARLMDGLVHICASAMGYRALAGCMGKPFRRPLLLLAEEACRNYRTLAAAYYLLTGKPAAVQRPPCPSTLCPAELLRTYYYEAVEAAGLFRRLASCGSPLSPQLRGLAAAEARHAGVILCLLQQMI